MNNIKHIFFDLDHTLWDFERNSALAFVEIFKKNKIDIGVEDFLQSYIPVNNFYWKKYRDNLVTKEELRFGRLNDTFNELRLKVSHDQINNLAEDYILHLPNNNYLFEDAISTLKFLQQKYILHVITNGFSEVQNLKLQNSNIARFFTTVTTSEEVGVKKPHPQIFEFALQKASAIPEHSLMIGDNLEADILGAENFGITAILYDEQLTKDYNGQKIKKLKQLIELL
ncbi:YjjG family noncanonical pyrimidine nucleotidase [Mesonia sp.]|uniref:YjjG family noncanonical pyrimidine nucleotidase n=1 Tax=Mesonia sp. TaxID=1960830 RepID=UPI0025BF632E|nr:YjjG family noncanonical pyrimidine nucleotidase [Mesonia sp.]